ncbi:hypothetical protein Ait01nite_054520 [Actinoplanes italicus]|uniref:Uncharacterized protein n=1 Tax=Actinoplanes italicus TaxID=113567 RepID=A0A2T0K8F5_9ACTN|nr:hypothetical protein [Actinoplanes italicus]PRX19014.1 hypothetical protein CLV67_111162 [Actinoplanes italicus]GIE32407.1 hypothetical protein Ait01nite_054520 [Actinoplanes italicus]
MAKNPSPAQITDASWWLMEQLLARSPGSRNGGIFDRKEGYHNTRKALPPDDYSVVEPPDKGGPSDKAAAYDWTFPDAQRRDYKTIAKFARRLLAAGKDPFDPRLDGWREFYGQADTVDQIADGWDFRHNRKAVPKDNDKHLWHIHLSESRNKVTDRANKELMLSVLRGETLDQWSLRTTGVATQRGWRWCNRCQGLWWAPSGDGGKCPAGGAHVRHGSGNYGLTYGPKAVGQRAWRWCHRCDGLWYNGVDSGSCPAGSGHVRDGSGDYVLPKADKVRKRQRSWMQCRKCQGLWYAGHEDGRRGRCAGGGGHESPDWLDYSLDFW